MQRTLTFDTPTEPTLPVGNNRRRKPRLQRRDDGWWVLPASTWDCGEIGPYDTKPEARDDMEGVARFYQEYGR